MYLVCGEALYDCFVRDGPDLAHARIDAAAGGSPFNVARGVARLGGRAAYFGGLSVDGLGRRLRALLEAEGVDTRHVVDLPGATPLSIVDVGADGAPTYTFHHQDSAANSVTLDAIPATLDEDIVGLHFGSYALVVRPVADALKKLAARHKDRFISLDPNVRPAIKPDREVWRRRLAQIILNANLIKVSREDLAWLHPGEDPAESARFWTIRADLVILTDGAAPVRAFRRDGEEVVHAFEPVEVVDAVGAGDAFQAALLTRIAELGPPAEVVAGLSGDALREVLAFAAQAAALTCTRRGPEAPTRAELTC